MSLDRQLQEKLMALQVQQQDCSFDFYHQITVDDLLELEEHGSASQLLNSLGWSAEDLLSMAKIESWMEWELQKHFVPLSAETCLQNMSRKFPKLNPDVENKFRMIRGRELKQHKVSVYRILKEVAQQCKAVSLALASTEESTLDLNSVDVSNCANNDCEILHPVLRFLQLLQKDLVIPGRPLAPLKPQFLLIGSIAEGTRMGKADEVDISISFQGLQDNPLCLLRDNGESKEDDALLHLGFTAKDCPGHLKRFLDDRQTFNYPLFLLCFLSELQLGINNIESSGQMPDPRLQVASSWQPCKICQSQKESWPGEPFTHCKKCAPTVTHTKIAPCLILRWKAKKGQKATMVTVDIVPRFPIYHEKGQVHLCGQVTRFLLDVRPPGWLPQFLNVVSKDRILPEMAHQIENEGSTDHVFTSTIQLLHYGPDSPSSPSCLLRPGQALAVNRDFKEDERLRSVYVALKGVNSLLRTKVSSYVLKKVVLQEDVRTFINNPTNSDNVSILKNIL